MGRIHDIDAKIVVFIKTNSITSGAAAKLRGKLSVMCPLAYGLLGRRRMNELIRRQFGEFAAGDLDAATENSLIWRRLAIKNLPP